MFPYHRYVIPLVIVAVTAAIVKPVRNMLRNNETEERNDKIQKYLLVNNKKIMDELMACCEDACDIHTKDQAEAVMIKVMSGNNKQNYSESLELLHNYIVNDFLPHTGKSYKRKAFVI